MNIKTQEAHKRQAVVKMANNKGKSQASRMYEVSLSSVKRWCKRYDETWQSLRESAMRSTCIIGITHRLIPPKTPWHNGKVERGHGNDQKYFYDWEHFRSVEKFN